MAIRRRAKRFGAFSVCARANISLDIKDVLDRCSTGSCELIARA